MKVPGVARLATLVVAAGIILDPSAAVAPVVEPAVAGAPPPVHRATAVHRPEAPVAVGLPGESIVSIEAVGTTPAGLLDVPIDIRTAGWWRGSSRIGDPFGTTVIAAHVDSVRQGLGPFASVLTLSAGQRVDLHSTRLTQSFAITSLRVVPRDSLARNRWIFAAGGERRLVLVTCAGPYVASAGGYQNLAVATGTPTGMPASRARRR